MKSIFSDAQRALTGMAVATGLLTIAAPMEASAQSIVAANLGGDAVHVSITDLNNPASGPLALYDNNLNPVPSGNFTIPVEGALTQFVETYGNVGVGLNDNLLSIFDERTSSQDPLEIVVTGLPDNIAFTQNGGLPNGVQPIASSFLNGTLTIDIPTTTTPEVFAFEPTTAVSAAPEPTTWVLMLTGLVGLGAVLRAQKKRDQAARPAPSSSGFGSAPIATL